MLGPFLSNRPVVITVQLTDDAGNPISVSSVEYRLSNQDDTELMTLTNLSSFEAESDQALITIAADKNVFSGSNLRELRILDVYLTTPEGVILRSYEYVISAEQTLVEGENSFQAYGRAVMNAGEIPRLDGWNDADKEERVKALLRARRNIGKLRFRYVYDDNQDIIDNTLSVSSLDEATVEEYFRLPQEFREALQRAQVIEADHLLGGDARGEFRRDGVMSMGAGEARQFFRPSKPLDGTVCTRTMKELAKWILTRKRISRT
jgi:hypothetical protein